MPHEPANDLDRTVIRIGSGATAWAYCADDHGELRQMSFGPAAHTINLDFPAVLYPRAIPTFGTEPHRRTALRVTHHDGTRSTQLRVTDIARTPTGHGEVVTITRTDPDLGVRVLLVTDVFDEFDVVTQHLEIHNDEPGPITVWEAASSSPILSASGPAWTHLGGGWANEWSPTSEPLSAGVKVVESTGGVRPHLQQMPAVLIAPNGAYDESTGTVIAAQIAWTGNTCFEAEVQPNGALRLLCGASFRAGDYVLDPGGQLVLPEVVWAWSDSGLGPLSRRLHEFTRCHRVRDGHRDRSIVANNWEATFFDFDEARLVNLVNDAADLGAELFLLDDGWFGESHPRDDDTQGLGDWSVDLTKLPNGLQPVIDAALGRDIRFGLWVEPEMANPGSTLFDEHPDWVLGDRSRREPTLERNQLALDLLNPDVRDFVSGTIDHLLTEYPQISYLKWDANRALVETGSPSLTADTQGRVFHDLGCATWDVMRRVAEAHPDVEMMLCASGGGRSDLGALRWFHELWTSDNTDPMDRLRMQWCASWFLPASVLGAHVTRWGDQPIGFAAAVAMSARFGWDLDTAQLDPTERSTLQRAATLYRQIRPLVQHGELYRLESPFNGSRSALGYVNAERDHAVVFGYQLRDDPDPTPPPLVLAEGMLVPTGRYTVAATMFDGRVEGRLDTVGPPAHDRPELQWPLATTATAVIWELTAEDRPPALNFGLTEAHDPR